jgi:hypothetical protein
VSDRRAGATPTGRHGDPSSGRATAPAAAAARVALARDGVAVLPGILSARWCARLRAAIERCRSTPSVHYGVLSPPGGTRVDSDLFRWVDDAALHALTHESPLVDWACALLDEDPVVLVEDQWFASDPGAATPSPWHQDQPYYRVDRPFLTIWVTLDDIEPAGSLRVLPGSHLGPIHAPVDFAASRRTVTACDERPAPPRTDADIIGDVRTWSLRAGDGIALDSRTLHATGAGELPHAFRRVSTRWAPAATRYTGHLPGTAAFWELIDHGRTTHEPLACASFPLVSTSSTYAVDAGPHDDADQTTPTPRA